MDLSERITNFFSVTKKHIFLTLPPSEVEKQSGNDMALNSFSPKTLLSQCRALRAELDPPLFWEWDGRFDLVLSIFSQQEAPLVRSILSQKFLAQWNRSNYRKAPKVVRSTVSCLGGLRAEQMLYTSEPNGEGVILFVAWWPWGIKNNVSLRVGIHSLTKSDSDDESLLDQLSRAFQATP